MSGAHAEGGWRPFVHEALFYRDQQQAVDTVAEFVRRGIVRRKPALVALPPDQLDAVRRELSPDENWVRFADITAVGVNPGRMLPWIDDWLTDQPSGARVVGELLWPGRCEAERTEVLRHEALANLALAGTAARLLCVFAEAALDARTRRAVERTHPHLGDPGQVRRASPVYAGPAAVLRETEAPLAAPEHPVAEVAVTEDLYRLRQTVDSHPAVRALPRGRREDFVLAINEVATNALKYDSPPRAVRLWRNARYVVGEVAGRGEIGDPLAGRRSPSPEAEAGRGLWMVHQLCDLVEVRNLDSRATLRLHMRCG
jgi:anti-sigma regulatory factor (Ser/Thr protein kinase)